MMDETPAYSPPCPNCGNPMRSDNVKTVIWVGEKSYLVEDIPAQVCDTCVEQFYDENTTDALRQLTEDKFPLAEAKREVLVPVFSLAGRIKERVAPVDYNSY
jgi:YgiT-type zinc finger domain-containing protein